MSVWKYEIEATFDCDCGRENINVIEYSARSPKSVDCRYCNVIFYLEQLPEYSIHEYGVGTRYFSYEDELDEYGKPL